MFLCLFFNESFLALLFKKICKARRLHFIQLHLYLGLHLSDFFSIIAHKIFTILFFFQRPSCRQVSPGRLDLPLCVDGADVGRRGRR